MFLHVATIVMHSVCITCSYSSVYQLFFQFMHYMINTSVLFFSIFDGNIAPNGAAINLGYYDAQLNNVSFRNHQGSVIRVCAMYLFVCM